MKAPLPKNEELRLAALKSYEILDSGDEQIYDDFTEVAAYIAGTPMALISIIDRDRQWFKSRIGIDAQETPRELSFCAHAILQTEPLHVTDASKDERFSDNPVVTGEPHIRFYFGAPLVTRGDFALGALCVADKKPRTLTPQQISALTALSRQVVNALEVRKCVTALAKVVADQHKDISENRHAMTEVAQLTEQLEMMLRKKRLDK